MIFERPPQIFCSRIARIIIRNSYLCKSVKIIRGSDTILAFLSTYVLYWNKEFYFNSKPPERQMRGGFYV